MRPEITDYRPVCLRVLDESPLWRATMAKGIKIADEYFKNWQLGYGTLLGAVREKEQYIKHDIDIDVDVLLTNLKGDDNIEEYDEAMVEAGFAPLRTQWFNYNGEKLIMSLAYIDPSNGFAFDVCFFRKFGDDYLHVGLFGMVIRPKYSVKRKEFKVGDINCYIPVEYDKYVTGRYGDS